MARAVRNAEAAEAPSERGMKNAGKREKHPAAGESYPLVHATRNPSRGASSTNGPEPSGAAHSGS